ncbi:MAG: AAA family ATPase [Bacilli bacterium]|nr:AAA family ATPase [Bacilli bacterium]
MRIHSLEVDNFRSFNKEIINFNDSNGNAKQFIVLIGDNGVGKTAILEAITKCFVPVIRTISNEAVKKCDLTNNDIKYNCGWTSIKTKIEIDNKQYYLLNRRRVSSSISINDNMDTKEQKVYSLEAKSTFLKRREEGKLPLILYYGINRVFNEIPKRGHIREYKIDDALKNCFDNSNNFRDFYEWYKTEEDIELRELRENKEYNNIQLNCVRNAISSMIKGYSNLKIKLNPSRMVITNSKNEELRIEQLSGGYKAILSVVSDIAKRLALANPHSINPLNEQAVILIDEIDLHLHPKWQKTIVADLKRTFPNCQFIVSTHSPFIVQSLKQEELINIECNETQEESGSFEGWSIEEIQEYKMNVETKTEKYKRLINDFTDAVDDENLDDVKKLYNELKVMLRPESQERKLIDIDMRMVQGND